ncbi:hypothetical protein [Actinopolyspora mortivallis]|uniref:hypothetical protein n=1 Tax=Actinopolyspora mortivallis TaxID=33906 RepID=UPI001C62CECF|nr:hypothetical protein [Actinopolyspora mortivallis]
MTADISQDPWATLDGLLGVEVAEAADTGLGAVAFYGRCSTEDNQDPETSYNWQRATPASSSSRSAQAWSPSSST